MESTMRKSNLNTVIPGYGMYTIYQTEENPKKAISSIQNLNEAEQKTYIKRDYIWPTPDAKKLVEEGKTPWIVFWQREIRKTIRKEAIVFSNYEPEDVLKSYLIFVQTIRDKVMEIDSMEKINKFYESMRKDYFGYGSAKFRMYADSRKMLITQYRLSRYQYYVTKTGFPYNTNMKIALELIKECNELRKQEGVQPVNVSDELMAMGQVDANWATQYNNHPGVFNTQECLAWGYSDPYDGWYYKEKANAEAGKGETGHYYAMINKNNTIAGFGYSRYNAIYQTNRTSSLILDENHDLITGKDYYDNTMSFEDYYNRFMNYYNDLMSAPEQAKDALNALNAAKAELESANKAITDAQKKAEDAKDKVKQLEAEKKAAESDASAKQDALDNAKKTLISKNTAKADAQAALNKANQKSADAKSEADQAAKTLASKSEALKSAQSTLNKVQKEHSEKQNNYDAALKEVSALKGDTKATSESAKAHQKQAEQALKNAKAAKTDADADAKMKETALADAKTAKADADTKVSAKETTLANAKASRDKIEAEVSADLAKKRENVSAREAAVKQAKAVAAEKEQAEKEALNSKSDAEAAKTSLEVKLADAKVDLSEKKTALANATSVKEQAQKEYDKVVEAITPLRNAKTAYEEASKEKETVTLAYAKAQERVDELQKKSDELASKLMQATDKLDRACKLDLEDAMNHAIEDEDFVYLNDYTGKIKSTAEAVVKANIALNEAKEHLAEKSQAYDVAKSQHSEAMAQLAIAKSEYDKYEAERLRTEQTTTNTEMYNSNNKVMSAKSAGNNVVKTGDASMIALYGVGTITGLGTALASFVRKKHK